MRVLVTGGAGYIGSHVCVELIKARHEVAIIDNLSNSYLAAARGVEEITGERITSFVGSVTNQAHLDFIFRHFNPHAVIHLAASKAVGESVLRPLEYYYNNLTGLITLLRTMDAHQTRRLIFSSSATVYGNPDPSQLPLKESARTDKVLSPYGRTKLIGEQLLQDLSDDWMHVSLRYFNPVGAHPSGLIGEHPKKAVMNLMPYITGVAAAAFPVLNIFGGDFPTYDGTAIRDYLHVCDLARGHVAALDKISELRRPAYNLGLGSGYSVLDVVRTFEKATRKEIPYTVVERRPGDCAVCYADPTAATLELDWLPTYSLEDACIDAWRWQSTHPHGYTTDS